jgi:PadR family transcriptional regulator PadR
VIGMGGSERLGQFEELVLLALVRLRDNAYGVAIRREISERTRRDISIGAVYTTLERLQNKGYVSSTLGEATAERGGRAKKYFQIRAPGERALTASRNAVTSMTGDFAHA